ncbi:MAG: ABC transporter ATP-binding protein [Deltaproteobacteria bacterium]|nr:ABC transporter ATP-binding protein [Deltaproteobacteria bacterium]
MNDINENKSKKSTKNPVIDVRHVSKHFATVSPVRDACFQIQQGEFVTLLGPSGSGKSTLLGLIAGFEQPSEGTISLEGQELTDLSEDELALLRRRLVGFVFQAFHLIPTLSALENVAFPLYPVKMSGQERRERAGNLLDKIGLGNRADHLPSRLSGGERQRVAIARALVNEPDILFCDEPTGNLDSTTGKEILNLLTELNREQGVTIFMVTHDQEIAKLSDRSLFMHDGEVTTS